MKASQQANRFPLFPRPALFKRLGLVFALCAVGLVSFTTLHFANPALSSKWLTPAASRSLSTSPTVSLRSEAQPSHTPLPVDGHLPDWPSTLHPLPLNASLDARLADWASIPVATAPEWHAWNLQTCPPHKNHDVQLWGYVSGMLKSAWPELWRNPTKIQSMRDEMFAVLRQARDDGLMDLKHAGHGKGVVFAAGNSDTFSRVLTSMRLLRHHFNSTLPAEVWSFPGEAPPEEVAQELQALQVKLSVVDMQRDSHRLKNYHLKGNAVLQSAFREVLFLDSDNIPAAALEPHFEAPAYKRLGAMFWPDYWKENPTNPVWQLIGVQARDEHSQEAGVFIIDKSKHMDALILIQHMLSNYQEFYKLSDGDKDLFRYAFLALRKRWAVPGRFVGAASWDDQVRLKPFCSHTMLQHDADGQPAFVHGNMLKKLPQYILFRDLKEHPLEHIWGKTKTVSKYTLAAHDVDADHLANMDLANGEGINKHSSPAVQRIISQRNYAEAGQRTVWESNRVYSACLNRNWQVPGSEDWRISIEQQSMITSKPIQAMLPLLDGELGIVEALWKDDTRLANFEQLYRLVDGKPQGKSLQQADGTLLIWQAGRGF